jgi:hypothetical protein
MRRRIHVTTHRDRVDEVQLVVLNLRRRIHVSYEEEDTCHYSQG